MLWNFSTLCRLVSVVWPKPPHTTCWAHAKDAVNSRARQPAPRGLLVRFRSVGHIKLLRARHSVHLPQEACTMCLLRTLPGADGSAHRFEVLSMQVGRKPTVPPATARRLESMLWIGSIFGMLLDVSIFFRSGGPVDDGRFSKI